jgi:dihydrofolate synthase/folylpolyglutamate synthase
MRRCAEVGATPVREGLEYGVVGRAPAVGGQLLALKGRSAEYDDIFLPLYGAHQAQNAAAALAAVEAFLGDRPLEADLVREALSRVTSPGRLEIIRRSPMILLDAAHNPHGAEMAAAALDDSFAFSPVVGVIGVMSDKEYEGVLAAFEPHLAHVVCTQNSTARALPATELAVTAREVFGGDRVSVAPRLADAIDEAIALAEAGEGGGMSIGSGAVLVTGSVVTVGEARAMLRRRDRTPGA